MTTTENKETLIERYTQLRGSHANGTPEHTAYYLIARALETNDVEGLSVLLAKIQENCARHEQQGHRGPVQYYTREIDLLQSGLIEIHEQALAEMKDERNQKRDLSASLTKEWNNLCNLQEYYKSWPLAELQVEAKKYGAEICRKKSEQITNIISEIELSLASRIDAAEHAIQEISEEIVEFEREVKRLRAQQIEVA